MAARTQDTTEPLDEQLDPTLPVHLAGATDFDADKHRLHSTAVMEFAKSVPRVWEMIQGIDAAANSDSGRGRRKGSYALAYLGFVFSGQIDVAPWWQRANSSIWRTAGFENSKNPDDIRPSYQTIHRRFCELEAFAADFEAIAAVLIRRAGQASGGRVGSWLHVDSTEAETHARLKHDCPVDSPCRQRKNKPPEEVDTAKQEADPDEGETPEQTRRRDTGLVTAGESVNEVRDRRHELAAEEEPEDLDALEIGDAEELDIQRDGDGREVGARVKVNGCWFRIRDPTAGVRAYTRGRKTIKFWVGFYNAKAVDHFTGAPVAVRVTSASVQEHHTYPELLTASIANTGREPRAVVGDRGYSISRVFELNTRLGIASVFPWRKSKGHTERYMVDCELYDRHGVVRCKHCGGPTQFIGFSKTGGGYGPKDQDGNYTKRRGPRLTVQCILQLDDEKCPGRQTTYCENSWRMLLPLWRTSPTYMALRHSGRRYERVHQLWRGRYRVGSDDHALRPKRKGRECQQLRANAALVVEWLIILWREGWMPRERPRDIHPERLVVDNPEKQLKSLLTRRENLQLDMPYGEVAVANGWGPLRTGQPRSKEDERANVLKEIASANKEAIARADKITQLARAIMDAEEPPTITAPPPASEPARRGRKLTDAQLFASEPDEVLAEDD